MEVRSSLLGWAHVSLANVMGAQTRFLFNLKGDVLEHVEFVTV